MKGERVPNLVLMSYTKLVMIGPNDVLFQQLVPLARHSSLPELKSLVALFRPKRVVPNQLFPSLFGLDYACMPAMFGPYLQPGGAELMREDIRTVGILKPDLWDKLVLEIKDVQAEHVSGKGAEELVRLWKQSQSEDVLKKPDMDVFKGDDGLLGPILTHLPAELASQLRANLPEIKARYERAVRDAPMRVDMWGENSSQTADGESQDDSWLAAHFLPEAAHQPLLGLSTHDEVDVSSTILVSEGTVVAESTVSVSAPNGGSDGSAAVAPPHPALDGAVPIFSPRFESCSPPRQPAVKEDQGRAPGASLSSKKRLRDPEPPGLPLKRRKASAAYEEEFSSSAASVSTITSLKSSSSISQKRPRQPQKPSPNTSSSPSVCVSSKLERKARHLGFKGEAEIQNLAAMREKLRAMTSKPVGDGCKLEHVPDTPDMGSSSQSKNSPQSAEDGPSCSLKKKVIQDIKDERSTARLRCVGSQSQGV